MTRAIQITDDIAFGGDHPPLFIAGPCVIESREHVLAMARTLRALRDALKINLVFKSSFDKANRTSIESFRGPGLEKGLELLREVKSETGLPVLSDIHEWQQALWLFTSVGHIGKRDGPKAWQVPVTPLAAAPPPFIFPGTQSS